MDFKCFTKKNKYVRWCFTFYSLAKLINIFWKIVLHLIIKQFFVNWKQYCRNEEIVQQLMVPLVNLNIKFSGPPSTLDGSQPPETPTPGKTQPQHKQKQIVKI